MNVKAIVAIYGWTPIAYRTVECVGGQADVVVAGHLHLCLWSLFCRKGRSSQPEEMSLEAAQKHLFEK